MKSGGAGAVLASLVLLQACGYALVGRGIATDPSIKRIGVVFRDGTGKPGLDQKITEKVIEELLKRGRFDVVQETEGVDAVVQGDILRYVATPVGFSQQGSGSAATTQASRYAIILTARVRYAKVGATEPIWQSDSLSVRDESDVGDSSDTFFDREDQVIDRLAASFARTMVSSMLEAF
jgi:hypothetical protein